MSFSNDIDTSYDRNHGFHQDRFDKIFLYLRNIIKKCPLCISNKNSEKCRHLNAYHHIEMMINSGDLLRAYIDLSYYLVSECEYEIK